MGYNFFDIKEVKQSFDKKLNEFIYSLGTSIGEGKDISFADNDITYMLKLQHDRIVEKGLEIEYEVYPREKEYKPFIAGSNWKDSHYESVVCFKQCGVKRSIKRDGKRLYKDNRKSVLYETMTDVLTGSHPDNDTCCCPNCGAVSTIEELQNGCPYCRTKYKMDDLFPKVTGYYFRDDVAPAGSESKIGMIVSMVICTVFLFFTASFAKLFTFSFDNILGFIGGMIWIALLSPVFGVVLGYFTYSFFLLFRLFAVAISTSSKMGTAGSRSKFESRMKKISPEFSFEYFTSKAISLIKTAVYSKDEKELLFFKGEALDPEMKDIIDMNYGGALGVGKIKEENGIVTVNANAFFDVLYAKGDKVFLKHQIFETTFQRRTDIPVNFNFSMTRISCPSCGISYDATKNKYCPGCGNEYEIISDDWALVDVRLK